MATSTSAPKKGTFSRYVLPVALFVGVIAGIAWLTQYMPSWREAIVPAVPSTNEPAEGEVIKYSRARGVWEFDEKGDDSGYVREFERGATGHYYFPFKNLLRTAAELGLLRVSCDCTYIEVCVLPKYLWSRIDEELREKPWTEIHFDEEPTWQKVMQSDTEGTAIPAEGVGLVRLTWKGKKTTGEELRIMLTMWSQPAGNMSGRKFEVIGVPVIMAPPVMSDPARQNIGVLGAGDFAKTEFNIWSATRAPDELDLGVANDDPLFRSELTPLDAKQRQELEQQLHAKKIFSKVRSAYTLSVTVHEEKEGKQMDQGPFVRSVPLMLDQLAHGGPEVVGNVKGEVLVGTSADQGKIMFKSFAARDGLRRVFPVWANPGVKLELIEHYPAALQVKLTPSLKETAGEKKRWNLELIIPPNGVIGSLPEHSGITLRIHSKPPRLIRIPISGTAGQG